jgi:peptidoglycan/LPS O-acetylase OafA/YrhL
MSAEGGGAAAGPAPGAWPADIAPLRGLRFIALAWVVLNQFRLHLGLHAGASFGIVGKGYLGAALFFVVAGFEICHAYERLRAEGRFRYPAFLWRGLIGFYPLHLVALAVMGALFLAGRALGAGFQQSAFDPIALPANVLLIHAWGVLPTVSWNFPSWLVSALWFALLVFPLTAWLALKVLRPTLIAVAAPLALFWAFFALAAWRGVLFTDMTAEIGALQTVPAFLLGAALHRLGSERRLPGPWPGFLALGAGAYIVVAASLRFSDAAIWPAFGVLTFAVAQTARAPRPLLDSRAFQFLGAMSISMSLVYLPVDIVYFHAIERFLGQPTGVAAWAVWWGVFPLILIAGALAWLLITRPAAAWLQRHGPAAARADPPLLA